MNKDACSIPHDRDGKRYIINCAGDKVPIPEAGFTSRCAIGNTDDYLTSFKDHISPGIVSLGEPALISIVVPSYASKDSDLAQIVTSLCSQEYPVPAEILVFINEPDNAPERVRAINTRNESYMRSLDAETADMRQGKVAFRCIRGVLSGGLAGVYQAVTVSLIARVRACCDQVMPNAERAEKIRCIEKYLQNALLLFCDDDMEIKDPRALAEAYAHTVKNDAVILGRLHIKSVDTVEKYSIILRDLMQLFLDLKYDHGLNFLTPRGILLGNILRVGGVSVGQLFADQLFFASAARGKSQYLLDASTSIMESDYPGNGNFLKKLRLYLEGKDNNALDIFENVCKRYQEDDHKGKYNAADIERLILNLKTRDIDKISSVVSGLLLPGAKIK